MSHPFCKSFPPRVTLFLSGNIIERFQYNTHHFQIQYYRKKQNQIQKKISSQNSLFNIEPHTTYKSINRCRRLLVNLFFFVLQMTFVPRLDMLYIDYYNKILFWTAYQIFIKNTKPLKAFEKAGKAIDNRYNSIKPIIDCRGKDSFDCFVSFSFVKRFKKRFVVFFLFL